MSGAWETTLCEDSVLPTLACVCVVSCSVVSESSVTPWTVAHQAPLSVGFPTQEYGVGASASPGDLPDPGIGLESLESPA